MENLIMKGGFKSPEINFDAEKGILELKGNSIPEKIFDMYEPVIKWIDNYIESPKEQTTFNFKITYFNSASKKYFLDIFERLKKLSEKGKKIKINWYYEKDDDEMEDAGKLYEKIVKIPINLITYIDNE